MNLCYSFQEIADDVWRRIESSQKTGLSYQEETITGNLLYTLNKNHPDAVRIRDFSKSEEALNGADWEWWIGNTSGQWLGMRIQAKRIKLPAENFGQIQTYKPPIKSNPNRKFQIDLLIENSKTPDLNAAYVLYTWSAKWPTLRAWPVYALIGLGPLAPQGVLFADAVGIKGINGNKLAQLAPICIPWHALVCACAIGRFGRESLAERVFSALEASRELAKTLKPEALSDAPVLKRPVSDLPHYLKELDSKHLAEIAKERHVRGFVVIDGDKIE